MKKFYNLGTRAYNVCFCDQLIFRINQIKCFQEVVSFITNVISINIKRNLSVQTRGPRVGYS